MANPYIKIQVSCSHNEVINASNGASMDGHNYGGPFNLELPLNGERIIRFTLDDIKNAGEASGIFSTNKIPKLSVFYKLVNHKVFNILGPHVIGIENEDDPDSSYEFTEINYKGLYCNANANNSDTLASCDYSAPDGVKVVKNLNINSSVGKWAVVNCASPNLRKFYGNIEVHGGGQVKLFQGTPIQVAAGDFIVSGVQKFKLCTFDADVGNTSGAWFNVLDLRNVDTSNCTQIGVLNNYHTPCTLIIGNFSNESLVYHRNGLPGDEYNSALAMMFAGAPKTGRVLVCTTITPPILKNCAFDSNDNALDTHDNLFDWVKKGKFHVIYVPKGSIDAYCNNTYIVGGVRGNTGWSYFSQYNSEYASRGEHGLFVEYDPTKLYLPKKEGGQNGKTLWLYRKQNR